jgi:DNA end-binding protein Ku
LILHTIYYADEVRGVDEIDRGAHEGVKETELTLARRLIDELTEKKFEPTKYHDNYRERVVEAAQQKAAGQEISEVPTEPRRGQVIDLMAALKASLEKRGAAPEDAKQAAQGDRDEQKSAAAGGHARAARGSGERKRAGGKK